MLTVIHKGFEKENCPLKFNDTDEEIRKFAKYVSEKIPDHVSSFVLIIDKYGYVTNAIPNRGGENESMEKN